MELLLKKWYTIVRQLFCYFTQQFSFDSVTCFTDTILLCLELDIYMKNMFPC